MDDAANDNIRWVPFGALAIVMLVATGFWKINKNLEEPIRPIDTSQPAQQAQSKLEGKPAPLFSLPTMDGKVMNLADYRGKIVFLNIWATWCPPCKEEMPSMQHLYERFKGENFEMLTISIDAKTEDVAPFMKDLGLTFPVAFDPEQNVAAQYGITGVPEKIGRASCRERV